MLGGGGESAKTEIKHESGGAQRKSIKHQSGGENGENSKRWRRRQRTACNESWRGGDAVFSSLSSWLMDWFVTFISRKDESMKCNAQEEETNGSLAVAESEHACGKAGRIFCRRRQLKKSKRAEI